MACSRGAFRRVLPKRQVNRSAASWSVRSFPPEERARVRVSGRSQVTGMGPDGASHRIRFDLRSQPEKGQLPEASSDERPPRLGGDLSGYKAEIRQSSVTEQSGVAHAAERFIHHVQRQQPANDMGSQLVGFRREQVHRLVEGFSREAQIIG